MKKTPDAQKNLIRFSVLIFTALLLAVSLSGAVSAGTYDSTSVIVFTDWHAHKGQSQAIIDLVSKEAAEHKNVIVCFNGDSENIVSKDDDHKYVEKSTEKWRNDHSYVTPFMKLADELLKNQNVEIVFGLGNHELGINDIGASDSEELASYIKTLKNRLGSRLHVVNTDLIWKSGGDMAQLYGGAIGRSAEIHGITFMAVVGTNVVGNEFKKYRKGDLYENIGSISRTLTTQVKKITDRLDSKSSCVLLAHAGLNNIDEYLQYMNLPKYTYLFTGHDHRSSFINSENYVRKVVQAEKYGEGAAVLYAHEDGKWINSVDVRLVPIPSNSVYEYIPEDMYEPVDEYVTYSMEIEG